MASFGRRWRWQRLTREEKKRGSCSFLVVERSLDAPLGEKRDGRERSEGEEDETETRQPRERASSPPPPPPQKK